MTTLDDQVVLKFLQDEFVEEFLVNKLGLSNLFGLTYAIDNIELRDISLAGIQNRQFQMPVFETRRTIGNDERIMPSSERWQINRSKARNGRLEWVEVFLGILLSTKIRDMRTTIESITIKNLIEELGGVASMTELRSKLQSRYGDSIVDAFFNELRINSIEDFKQKGNLFLEFVFKALPPFDPDDPQNVRMFPLNVCIKIHSELNILEALQMAKLCRNILENEKDFAEIFDGGDIKTPYAFVVIFPDSVVVDNTIPGLTKEAIKTSIQNLFAAENMLAHFFV